MARKNRKKRQGGHVFPAPLAVILVVVAGLSLLYICLNAKTEALGREIKMLEVKRDVLRDTLIKAQYEWAQAQSPANLVRLTRASIPVRAQTPWSGGYSCSPMGGCWLGVTSPASMP